VVCPGTGTRFIMKKEGQTTVCPYNLIYIIWIFVWRDPDGRL